MFGINVGKTNSQKLGELCDDVIIIVTKSMGSTTTPVCLHACHGKIIEMTLITDTEDLLKVT